MGCLLIGGIWTVAIWPTARREYPSRFRRAACLVDSHSLFVCPPPPVQPLRAHWCVFVYPAPWTRWKRPLGPYSALCAFLCGMRKGPACCRCARPCVSPDSPILDRPPTRPLFSDKAPERESPPLAGHLLPAFFTDIGGMHPRVWLFLPALCRAFAASPCPAAADRARRFFLPLALFIRFYPEKLHVHLRVS